MHEECFLLAYNVISLFKFNTIVSNKKNSTKKKKFNTITNYKEKKSSTKKKKVNTITNIRKTKVFTLLFFFFRAVHDREQSYSWTNQKKAIKIISINRRQKRKGFWFKMCDSNNKN